MKPITPARRRELDREAERIGASYDTATKYEDPKQHPFSAWPGDACCWHCGKWKEAHEQEKK